jgi:hypothetical protein
LKKDNVLLLKKDNVLLLDKDNLWEATIYNYSLWQLLGDRWPRARSLGLPQEYATQHATCSANANSMQLNIKHF